MKTYDVLFTSELPHQQRVIEEAKELGEKAKKLDEFIQTNSIFKSLPEDEQNRLIRQLEVMNEYFDILIKRIQNF